MLGSLHFMLSYSSNCSCLLQFMLYKTFVPLLSIYLISCCVFPLYWLMICDLIWLLSDKWYVKRQDNVAVVKPICLWNIILLSRFDPYFLLYTLLYTATLTYQKFESRRSVFSYFLCFVCLTQTYCSQQRSDCD